MKIKSERKNFEDNLPKDWEILFIQKWIRKQMAYKGDVFFNAKQSVEYGLADKIKE